MLGGGSERSNAPRQPSQYHLLNSWQAPQNDFVENSNTDNNLATLGDIAPAQSVFKAVVIDAQNLCDGVNALLGHG